MPNRKFEWLEISTGCGAANSFFVVGPSGHVRVCNHSETQLAHVSQIETLKQTPYWQRFTFKRYLLEPCGECELRHACDGGCREAAHITTGSVEGMEEAVANRASSRLGGASVAAP